jgi:hypothetical protein
LVYSRKANRDFDALAAEIAAHFSAKTGVKS